MDEHCFLFVIVTTNPVIPILHVYCLFCAVISLIATTADAQAPRTFVTVDGQCTFTGCNTTFAQERSARGICPQTDDLQSYEINFLQTTVQLDGGIMVENSGIQEGDLDYSGGLVKYLSAGETTRFSFSEPRDMISLRLQSIDNSALPLSGVFTFKIFDGDDIEIDSGVIGTIDGVNVHELTVGIFAPVSSPFSYIDIIDTNWSASYPDQFAFREIQYSVPCKFFQIAVPDG